MNFTTELKRRNVFRVGTFYIVSSWLILQAGDVLFGLLALPDWTLRLVLGLLILGFPVALGFAWVFEMTPDGLRRERDIDRSRSVTPETGRKLNVATLIVAGLAIVLVAGQQTGLLTDPARTDEPTAGSMPVAQPRNASIAVLPFADLSPDGDQAYFVDGLAEEILNALSRAPDLTVASRTSSFQFRGGNQDVRDIAQQLGVAHVLEGSVRRTPSRIRVTAQLIEAASGGHLWSHTYDRTPDDIIEIQEDVATEIAGALDTAMDPAALEAMVNSGTQSVSAYVAYLRAQAQLARATETGSKEIYFSSKSGFEEAIGIDPEYSAAHAGLADHLSYLLFVSYFWADDNNPTLEILPIYRRAIANAIRYEADPVRRLAHQANLAHRELRIADALALNSQLLEARPNDAKARELQIFLHLYLDNKAGMLAVGRNTLDSGVYSGRFAAQFVRALVFGDVTDGLGEVIEQALERYPAHAETVYQSHRGLLWLGRPGEANRLLPLILSSDMGPDNKFLAQLRQLCAENRDGEAQQLFETKSASLAKNIRWLTAKIAGRSWDRETLVRPYDDAQDMLSMWSFYEYGFFDARPYPNLMALLDAQNITPHAVAEIPYQCSSPPD